MTLPYAFISGWDPDLAERGRTAFLASGRTFYTGPQFVTDDRPLPPGYSMSGFLKWPYDQGQVGSCFANMGAVVLQLMMLGTVANKIAAAEALGLKWMSKALQVQYDDNSPGSPFNPSRALIWYQCRKLDGSLGSGADGGSIVNTFAALGDAPRGVGDCSEELWPYKPSHSWLERTPSSDVLSQASQTRIEHIAEAPFNADTWKRSIFNLAPIGIGIYWPSGWDTSCDKYGRITGIGGGGFGHALAVIGWVDDWDGHRWWEIQNSHGPIYGTPPAEVAKGILGYKPSAGDKSFSFWAREDWFHEVLGYRNTEVYNAADVRGFVPKPINTPTSFHSAGKWS